MCVMSIFDLQRFPSIFLIDSFFHGAQISEEERKIKRAQVCNCVQLILGNPSFPFESTEVSRVTPCMKRLEAS